MRALMILTVMLGLSAYAVAGCENSTLVIRTQTGKPVKVYVDGMTGRNRPTTSVTVNGLTPGRHQLKVVAVYTDYYGYTKRRTIYTGMINVRPSMYMDALVEEGRGVSIHETKQACNDQYDQGYQQNNNGYGNNTAPSYSAPQQDNTQQGNTTYQSPQPANSNVPAHISDDDFEQLKSTVSATQYETQKMDTLKVLIGANQFTTSQVSALMGLFAFESNKLDVAKLLYDRTVDKQNYGRLASNFNFDARKEDFKKFMAGK